MSIERIFAPSVLVCTHKGFEIKTRYIDDIFKVTAQEKETGVSFAAEGGTTEEGVKQVVVFIDMYRQKVPEKIILS